MENCRRCSIVVVVVVIFVIVVEWVGRVHSVTNALSIPAVYTVPVLSRGSVTVSLAGEDFSVTKVILCNTPVPVLHAPPPPLRALENVTVCRVEKLSFAIQVIYTLSPFPDSRVRRKCCALVNCMLSCSYSNSEHARCSSSSC